jgi:hypothetical protein
MKKYDLVLEKPVVKLYYRGTHEHPVRRTGLVIEDRDNHLTVVELREGRKTRTYEKASQNAIKTYRKDRIAKYGDYCGLRRSDLNRTKNPKLSTLRRLSLIDLIREGV